MQVLVLAGGLGTRLRPVTERTPKPMVQVGNTPFLEILVTYIAAQGFLHFIFATGYLGHVIGDHFGDGRRLGVHIAYSHEDAPAGTGGCLQLALPLIEGPFLVLNGDTFLPVNYRDVTAAFSRSPMPLVVACTNHAGLTPNNLRVEGDLIVDCCSTGPNMTHLHAGARLLTPDVLGAIPKTAVSIEDAVYKPLIARRQLRAFVTDQRFYDIGTPERLADFESFAATIGLIK